MSMIPGSLVRAGAALALSVQASCLDAGRLDLALIVDAAFPAKAPGLPADRPWVSLPVGTWVVADGLDVQAVSACFAPACAPAAAVILLRARGPRAAELARALDEPARLEALLMTRSATRPPSAPDRPRAAVTVERRRDGGASGFVVRLARTDGTRPAGGFVLARRSPAGIALVLAIAPDEATAESLARQVAPHLG